MRLNKRLSKQSWGWWFETPSRSLWRHCNELVLNTWWWLLTKEETEWKIGQKKFIKEVCQNCSHIIADDVMAWKCFPYYLLFVMGNQWWEGNPVVAHYNDVIMSAMSSLITRLTIVYSSVYSSADQRKHQSSASLAFVMGIHRWPVNSQHKGPVTRKMFPFDDVIMHHKGPVMGALVTSYF